MWVHTGHWCSFFFFFFLIPKLTEPSKKKKEQTEPVKKQRQKKKRKKEEIQNRPNIQPRRKKKRRKKKEPNSQPRKRKEKKSQKMVKSCGCVLFVGPLCVFNYNIVIELWVMETENNQNVFSISITPNSKIRELSDGNRVMEIDLLNS